jgi:GNAT superfamily N-acetyltransferase
MHPLDNVIWQALMTRHSQFAERHGNAARFTPDVARFAAFEGDPGEGYASLSKLVGLGETVRMFLESPYLESPYEDRHEWAHVGGTRVVQMVWDLESARGASVIDSKTLDPKILDSKTPPPKNEGFEADRGKAEIVQLGAADSNEMKELTALTKPGPFERRTHELGTYLGIKSEGKLIAMAGERMKVPGFTEVSAVCTHPEHTGRGYARMLMSRVMQGIFERGETPFLDVREDNARAIGLYELLGFRKRSLLHLAVLRKT